MVSHNLTLDSRDFVRCVDCPSRKSGQLLPTKTYSIWLFSQRVKLHLIRSTA